MIRKQASREEKARKEREGKHSRFLSALPGSLALAEPGAELIWVHKASLAMHLMRHKQHLYARTRIQNRKHEGV